MHAVTSVSTGRPEHLDIPLGTFIFSHIKMVLFFGYEHTVIDNQKVFIAAPEKALLDLIYIYNLEHNPRIFSQNYACKTLNGWIWNNWIN